MTLSDLGNFHQMVVRVSLSSPSLALVKVREVDSGAWCKYGGLELLLPRVNGPSALRMEAPPPCELMTER